MATSSLSSLGLGSDGALSYDTIDKLRKADEAAILTPIDKKITTNTTRQTDLAALTKLATTLQSSTGALADELSYLKRTTTASNTAVSVTAASGTDIQNVSIHVNTLAKQDIYQTTGYSSQTSTIASASDTLQMQINGKTYDFNITSATTLSDLKTMINDKMDGKVTASVLNVGGTDPYKLIIKSDDMGSSNAITFTSGTTAIALGLAKTVGDTTPNANHLQTATDASFIYNGVTVSRSSNTISDLAVGMTYTLNEEQATNVNTTISITQDWTDVKKNLTSLVSSYNDLIANLNEATTYDSATKTAGTFQGVSQITSLSTSIRQQILKVDSSGRNLTDYGIALNDSGLLEFNSTTFNKKIASNPDDIKDFFVGSTTYSTTSYTGTEVSAGALNVGTNDLLINGTSVKFTTTTGATVADNLAALKAAIKSAGITGIEATIGSNNNIFINNTVAGSDLTIAGTSSILSSLGLKATSVYTKSTSTEGLFTLFNNSLKSFVDSTGGVLSLYKTSLTNEKTSLTKERAADVTKLDTKYETMATRFAAYDSIISKLNNQFSSLSTMIKQSYATK